MDLAEYEALAAVEDAHWWYTGMAAISRRLIARALAGDRPDRVLDAGCGAGGALVWLAEFGPTYGCDFHPAALGHAQRKAGSPLARADVQCLPYRAGSFGLVTSFDVLYHRGVPDDERALREFWRVLRPGGWLCLRVPAHDWLRRGHDRRVHTRRRYDRRGLRGMLERTGFARLHLSPAAAPALLAALLAFGAGRLGIARSAPVSDLTLPPPLLNRFLKATLTAEAALIERGRLPFGLSLYAICQKPPEA